MKGMCVRKDIVIVLWAGLCTLPAYAQSAGEVVMPGIVAATDSQLADMRGKYVASATQVVYFGVMMQSNWQTPDGTVLGAGANVIMDFSGATPAVRFIPTASLNAGDNAGSVDTSGRVVTSSGLNNVSGITQSVQVVGDQNSTHNLVRVNFLRDVPVDEALGLDLRSAVFVTDGPTGMSAYSGVQDNSVMVSLDVPGQGSTEQSIRGAIPGATGRGVYQSIVALGDRHLITNQLDMNVVLGNSSQNPFLSRGIGGAIDSLRGMAPGM